jgi:hypothetical protein
MDELLEVKLKGIVPDKETLCRIAAQGKVLSLAEVKKRTMGMTDKSGRIISADGVALDPDLPTVWMVRRMVEYKSQLPILKDIIHVVCADTDQEVETRWGRMNGLRMQVVMGGVAPQACLEGKVCFCAECRYRPFEDAGHWSGHLYQLPFAAARGLRHFGSALRTERGNKHRHAKRRSSRIHRGRPQRNAGGPV